MNIICRNARPSTTDVDMAVDVDVEILMTDDVEDDDGEPRTILHTLTGTVTLVHNPDNRSPRGLVAYGTGPDQWVSGALLKGLKAVADGNWDMLRDTLRAVEAAALACAVEEGLV